MRVLVITNLFPNSVEPALAPFNRRQFEALAKLCHLELLALIPWLPGAGLLPADHAAAKRRRVPRRERISELDVLHPRVLYAPRAGRFASGLFYAGSLLPYVWARRHEVDVVLGSFAYPDGWAAAVLARILGVPAVIKVHGTDVNVYENDWLIRPRLCATLRRATEVVAPSQALIDRTIALGADREHATVIFNGVDKERFRVRDVQACRQKLGLSDDKRWIVFVGRIERDKGVFDLIDAVQKLDRPDTRLVWVGDGAARSICEASLAGSSLAVTWAGARPPEEVATWMGASDLVTLPSFAEGTPNVVIEAICCGRPVVATRVGGIPAVLCAPELGRLVPPHDPSALAAALADVLDRPHNPTMIAQFSNFPTWAQSAEALYDVLRRAVLSTHVPAIDSV